MGIGNDPPPPPLPPLPPTPPEPDPPDPPGLGREGFDTWPPACSFQIPMSATSHPKLMHSSARRQEWACQMLNIPREQTAPDLAGRAFRKHPRSSLWRRVRRVRR